MDFQDRLLFNEQTLGNGICVRTQPRENSFTSLELSVPLGSAHTGVSGIPDGGPHLLEHLLINRSKRAPGYAEYSLVAGLEGGTVNAHTNLFQTTYELSAPNESLRTLLPLLFSAVFEPVFREADIVNQSGIIINERQREYWWPEDSEVSHYLSTKWQGDDRVSIDRVFGKPELLAATTTDQLTAIHAQYFTPGISVTGVGSGDLTPLTRLLEGLVLPASSLQPRIVSRQWVNREYHSHPFAGQSTYDLIVGGFSNRNSTPQEAQALSFLLRMLTNEFHGPLWKWLRHDLGKTYGIEWDSSLDSDIHDWALNFSMSRIQDVEMVRRHLFGKIEMALRDTELLEKEVRRRTLYSAAYLYETSQEILEDASNNLYQYGRIITETEWQEYLKLCAKPGYLAKTLEPFLNPSAVGWFCATPEEV